MQLMIYILRFIPFLCNTKKRIMSNDYKKWIYLIVLAMVWGSSFILIKKSLIGLTPVQLGALRTFIAGVFILLIGFRSLKKFKNINGSILLLVLY